MTETNCNKSWTDKAHQFAVKVKSGEEKVGPWIRSAVDRYFDDLQNPDYTFDVTAARRPLAFFRKVITHTIGQHHGKPFEPLPWQAFTLWNIYGFHNLDGSRRFQYVLIFVARKNGKSTFLAAWSLWALFEEEVSEVYFAATKRDQARISFNEAARMAKASPVLNKRLKVLGDLIRYDATSSSARVLASDVHGTDGLSPVFAGIDEYHAHKTDALFNVLKSAQGARRNPLHVTITTAGLNPTVPAFQYYKQCQKILEGSISDPAQFAMLFTLDDGDNWTDPEVFYKANPSLGKTISRRGLQNQLRQAMNSGGSAETEFRAKHLNEWVEASVTWIADRDWMQCISDEEPLGPCWGGLDLASVADITALIMCWESRGNLILRGFYWLPEETVEKVLRSDPSHPYRDFIDLPNFILTPGNVTDYDSIRRTISGVHTVDGSVQIDDDSLMQKFDVKSVGFDRYNSTQIAAALTDDGLNIQPCGQGFTSLSEPTKEFERRTRGKMLLHNGDPVLRWALSNVVLRTDPAGNIKPDKGKSANKIDPIVSAVMAIREYCDDSSPAWNTDDISIFTLDI